MVQVKSCQLAATVVSFCADSRSMCPPAQLVHDRYNTNQNIKLSEWSAISGFICALFTFCVPHLHHLRVYSGISVVLIFIFSIIALAISIHDRASLCLLRHCREAHARGLLCQLLICGLVSLGSRNAPGRRLRMSTDAMVSLTSV